MEFLFDGVKKKRLFLQTKTSNIMGNTVGTKSIIELRDGRLFFVPAYQRGYRWNQKQVFDLLDDLFSFSQKKNKDAGEFYCLQPIIVKKITDSNRVNEIIEQSVISTLKENNVMYEVIDGQQRLTTLYILLQHLINKYSFEDEKASEKSNLFRLIYETRPEMSQYLENIDNQNDFNNLDQKHAMDAYQWVEEWLESKSSPNMKKRNIADKLSFLLQQDKDTDESCGSVQVIWYEISEEKDVVREFLSVNNGKIKLTDAELIKALFLQKRNFENDSKNLKQMEKALEWEHIENVLHQDDFWYFINKDEDSPSNRIEFVLRLVDGIKDPKEGELFVNYNKLFDGKSGFELEKAINAKWGEVIDCFRTIEDWYYDPIKYNYIGYLSHSGCSVYSIYEEFKGLGVSSSQDGFIDRLRALIKETLKGIKIDGDFLNKDYKHRGEIRKVLLLLNIHTLNTQLSRLRKVNKSNEVMVLLSPTYKFPFDVYVNQKWDVEHIDSRTTNNLSSIQEKQEWVKGYYDSYESLSNDNGFVECYNNGKWDECIQLIKKYFDEEESEIKDEIGNLTLLDRETNRSYGNAIFPEKRRRILQEIRNGKYVPHCTQMVFYKSFVEKEPSNPKWNDDCKREYAKYVCNQIKDYLNV